MSDVYRNLIIEAAHRDLARSIAETLAPTGGQGMWVTGLSPDGQPPQTHWFSMGFIDPEFAALLPLNGQGGQPALIVSLCAEAGLDIHLEDVEALLAGADVSEEDGETAWGRLGLQLVLA